MNNYWIEHSFDGGAQYILPWMIRLFGFWWLGQKWCNIWRYWCLCQSSWLINCIRGRTRRPCLAYWIWWVRPNNFWWYAWRIWVSQRFTCRFHTGGFMAWIQSWIGFIHIWIWWWPVWGIRCIFWWWEWEVDNLFARIKEFVQHDYGLVGVLHQGVTLIEYDDISIEIINKKIPV